MMNDACNCAKPKPFTVDVDENGVHVESFEACDRCGGLIYPLPWLSPEDPEYFNIAEPATKSATNDEDHGL